MATNSLGLMEIISANSYLMQRPKCSGFHCSLNSIDQSCLSRLWLETRFTCMPTGEHTSYLLAIT